MKMNMTRSRLAIVPAMVLACAPARSFAAERGQIGLSALAVSRPELGLSFWPTARLGLRPILVFSRGTRTLVAGPLGAGESVESTSTSLGVGLDVLYHLSPGRDLSPYVFGGLAASRSSLTLGNTDRRDAYWFQTARAGFGLEYSFNRRLSAFGETGLVYNWGRGSHSVNTYGATIGLSFYLK
jgi:hypothetical protein